MVKLWRGEVCRDPYIGNGHPINCPFYGTHKKYIKEGGLNSLFLKNEEVKI